MQSTQVASIDMLKLAGDPFTKNLPLTLIVPAILLTVPFVLVGVPASIAAVFVVGKQALMRGGAPLPALIPVIAVAAPIFAILYNGIRVGWTRIILKLVDGQPASISDLFQAKQWFLSFLIVNVIIGLATAAGGFAFIIPGLYIAVRTAFAPFLVVDQNMGPIEALIKSNEMVTGYAWQVLIYFVLFGIVNAVAGFIPIIGMFLPIAVIGYFDVALAMIYRMRVGGNLR